MLLHSSREAKHRPPLPAEPCLYPPIRQNDKRQTYLSLAMENCAGICYPLEKFRIMSYIPLKQNKYRDRLFSTPIALESVLAVGSLMQPEESSIAFATAHAAFVERMITDCISDGTGKSDPVKRLVLQTFHCLAALYIGLGDLSALRTHTKALQQFIESEDPLDVVDSHDLTKARKSLIDKLICTGFPQEHIPRRFQLLPCLLQPHDIGLIMSTLRPHLQACHVNADIADNMIAACIFAWTMREAKECGFGETFEPENVMEDYDCLQIDLLTTPYVLRHQFRSVTSPPSPEDLQVSSPSTSGLSHCAHQDLLEAFEDAVRITTLLCLRAAILQTSPTAKQSYSMLLNRLVDRLQILLDWIYPKAYDSAFIDPTVLNEQQNQGTMLSIGSARPFLIWMSIIGYQLSVYYGFYHKGWSYHHSEGCIYLKILVSVGICDTADVDLCTNDDVAIFDMLNLNWATDYDRQSFELLRWIVK
ncbi:hypothetical protein G7054_g3900 [Neopestalotiopsis clavispora]|nr:hypothetical protein G7054_g3900 [Neopestalotiopsis clavispora]